uniref:DUF5666 domain-containing protein n=1 Tax=mine drainage metagenome TaxID=410659 RepID=E6QLQ0_9ZZZZ
MLTQLPHKPFAFVVLAASSALALATLSGCGSSASSTVSSATAQSAPTVVTVSDAPLGSILSARVTLSSVTLGSTATGSTPASVLSSPVTVELSGLGAVQEPIEISSLAQGTYNSVTLTVSGATVVYTNSSGQIVTATATLASPTVTVALSPSLVVNSTNELQLQLAFNLAQSFSITGTTVSFTPAINTTGAQVGSESPGDRQVEVTGNVVSVSSSSIVVQSGDSGKQFTFTVNGTTQLPTGVSLSSIATGDIVQVQGQTQTDGSILATSITIESTQSSSGSGGQEQNGAKGIVLVVTQNSAGGIASFTMLPRENFGSSMSGNNGSLTVNLSSSTTYALPEDAQQAGLTASSFTAADIFPGESVTVSGTASGATILDATQIMLASESIPATLVATPSGTAPDFNFSLTIAAPSFLTTYSKMVTLNGTSSTATEYGNGLTQSGFAALAAGASIEVHGYLLQTSPGTFALYATKVAQIQAPETPEGGSSGDN